MDNDFYALKEFSLLLAFSENSDDCAKFDAFSPEKDSGNEHSYFHEILITIFFEVFFALAHGNAVGSGAITRAEKFIPNYETLDVDALFEIVKEKIEYIGYITHIDKYDKLSMDQNDLKILNKTKYCLASLNHHNKHKYFETPEGKQSYYHHSLNIATCDKNYKKLEEVFTVMDLNDIFYKISFVKL